MSSQASPRGRWVGGDESRPTTAKSVHFAPVQGVGTALPSVAVASRRPGTAPGQVSELFDAADGFMLDSMRRPATAGQLPPVKREKKHPTTKEIAAAKAEAERIRVAKEKRDNIPPEMKEGMMTLLRMHNADELRFFTQNFGFADDLSKEDRIAKLDADVLIDEPQYHRALSLIWEGIVIEYWRSLGKGIKNYRFDLKHMVWTWWLRGRDELELDKDEWTPIYTPLEERPDRVVEERVTTDDRVSTWVKGMRSQEERIVEAERTLRLSKDFTSLMTLLGGHARLRHYEAHGREAMLADLQLVRKHLETANTRNHTLYEQLNVARDTLVTCDTERLDWRKQYRETYATLTEVQLDMKKLKAALGVTLKEVRAENKQLRMTLHTTNGVLDEFKQKHAEEVASNKALHKHNKELAATVEARKQEISSWFLERERSRAQMEYLLHESVHHGSLIDVYFDNSALLAVEKAEMTQHLADRERELRNMALMLHAEDETRYAMLKNPKAFKRVKPSKKKGKKGKRGRSPAKKKKGGAAGGKSKSKGKSKGKSPSKRSTSKKKKKK